MNELDQFVKHRLKVKHYIRYADDFVLLSKNRNWLEQQIPPISNLLQKELKLVLHPQKVSIKTLSTRVDFLGWVHFPNYRVLRIITKRRMKKKVGTAFKTETINSYLGLLEHGDTYKLQKEVLDFSAEGKDEKKLTLIEYQYSCFWGCLTL